MIDNSNLMSSLGEIIYSAEKRLPEEIAAKAESHAPRIESPDVVKPDEEFTVKIVVGPHPSTEEHSIRWIDVYFSEEDRTFNPIHIARVELGPGYAQPEITLRLRLRKSGTIYAIAYCNKHGLWESRKGIRVSK